MAMWLAATTDRFASAVSENGVSDLAAALSHNPAFWSLELRSDEADGPARIRERSPVTHAGAIAAPLLLVHAECDTTSLPAQSRAMFAGVEARASSPVELLIVPDEDHMVNVRGRPSRRMAKLRATDAFLGAHLSSPSGGRPGAPPRPPATQESVR
jgi:dipeptidyl aminopeptidase/acylaminoacyl peptidase